MKMLPLKKPNPIKGDDLPFNTIALRDCPDGFHFSALIPDASLVHTYEIWSELIGFAERYYADWEINGTTFASWLYGLQESYDANKLTFEKMLETLANVKYDHGQKVTTIRTDNQTRADSRTKTGASSDTTVSSENGSDSRTRQGGKTESNQREYNESAITEQNGVTKETALAFDSTNDDPSKKSDTAQNQNGVNVGSEGTSVTSSEDGSESGGYDKSTLSSVERGSTEGEKSSGTTLNDILQTVDTDRFQGEDSLEYYKRLMENYPNIFMKFVDMFKDDFLIHEVLIW